MAPSRPSQGAHQPGPDCWFNPFCSMPTPRNRGSALLESRNFHFSWPAADSVMAEARDWRFQLCWRAWGHHGCPPRQQRTGITMRNRSNRNFRQICDSSRREAASAAWERASRASVLRRALTAQRRFTAARYCGEVKAQALRIAASLLPREVRVTIDADYQIGLVSVRWKGRGRFHLPADWTVEG